MGERNRRNQFDKRDWRWRLQTESLDDGADEAPDAGTPVVFGRARRVLTVALRPTRGAFPGTGFPFSSTMRLCNSSQASTSASVTHSLPQYLRELVGLLLDSLDRVKTCFAVHPLFLPVKIRA